MCNLVSNNSNDRRKYAVPHPNNFTASALFTGTRENSQSIYCIYCRKNHPSSKCDVVTDVTVRKSILRRKGRCFLCLKTGHIIRQCEAKYKCVKCKGRHNVSICEPQPQPPPPPPPNVILSTSVVSNRESTTFLQTAKAIITDVNMNIKATVRVLFDGCSQKSFITEHVSNSLNLRVIRNEKMIVHGFGA